MNLGRNTGTPVPKCLVSGAIPDVLRLLQPPAAAPGGRWNVYIFLYHPVCCRRLGCLKTSRKHYLPTFRHLKHSLQIWFLQHCSLLARQLFLFPGRLPSLPAKISSVPKLLSAHTLAHFPLRYSVIYLFTCAKRHKNVSFC